MATMFFLQKGLNILSSDRYHVKRLLELTIAQGLTSCHDILNVNAPFVIKLFICATYKCD